MYCCIITTTITIIWILIITDSCSHMIFSPILFGSIVVVMFAPLVRWTVNVKSTTGASVNVSVFPQSSTQRVVVTSTVQSVWLWTDGRWRQPLTEPSTPGASCCVTSFTTASSSRWRRHRLHHHHRRGRDLAAARRSDCFPQWTCGSCSWFWTLILKLQTFVSKCIIILWWVTVRLCSDSVTGSWSDPCPSVRLRSEPEPAAAATAAHRSSTLTSSPPPSHATAASRLLPLPQEGGGASRANHSTSPAHRVDEAEENQHGEKRKK